MAYSSNQHEQQQEAQQHQHQRQQQQAPRHDNNLQQQLQPSSHPRVIGTFSCCPSRYVVSLLLLVFFVSVPTVAQTIGETDALELFYDALEGENWDNNTNWKTDVPVCSWYGVSCAQGTTSSTSGVTHITLNQNNLHGGIPPEFWTLPALQHVQMRGNSITSGGFEGLQPSEGQPKSPIEMLVLSENLLSDFVGIGNAKATLRNLNLNKNLLDKQLPDELFDAEHLETLYVAFNQIPGTLPTLVGQLTKLSELYAFGNKLTGTIPTEIGLLNVCQILGLGNNDFTGTIPTEINTMLNMRDLSVHHIQDNNDNDEDTDNDGTIDNHGGLSGPLPTFGDMPFLTLLFLDGNSFTGSIPDDFLRHNNNSEVPISVGLANNFLTGSIPASLKRFQSLSLDLVGNQITDIPSELCDLGGWMGGLVEQFKCDAILCAKDTFNPDGRATRDDSTCVPCNDSYPYLGAITCESSPQTTTVEEPWKYLMGFYLAMGGEGWDIADGWKEIDTHVATALETDIDTLTVDVCDGWYGVVCENGEVVELSLPQNNLFGTIPDNIFLLPKLRVFDVSGNNVLLEHFESVSKATSLESLVLSDTKIKSLEGINSLAGVHLLYLDGIDVGGNIPTELFELTDLTILHLQHGSFNGNLPTLIGQLTNLELLNLYGNNLTGNLPTELGELTMIHTIDLSENKFGGRLPTELSLLTSLGTFSIHQSEGTLGGELPAFDMFPSLRELNLESNTFYGSIPGNFLAGVSDKSEAIQVYLGMNQLTGDIPSSLADFDNMNLRLEGNLITGIPEELCSKTDWMDGEVGELPEESRCNAILCPPRTWNEDGKETTSTTLSNSTCLSCAGNIGLYGQVSCGDAKANKEKEILDKLFALTGGRYWSKPHDNWSKPGVPICSREGVACQDDLANEGVMELRLHGYGLRGTIPTEVYELPSVRALGFTGNPIDISFDGIEKATKLIVLKLSKCQLRQVHGLRNAPPKLLEVHLAENQLQGSIPEDIFLLENVNKVFLNNNHLTGRIPSNIAAMTGLREMWLWDNELTGALPSELGTMSNLEVFSVNDNRLSGTIPPEFENLENLSRLLLARQTSSGKFEGVLPAFAQSPHLTEIDFSENGFSGWLPPTLLAGVSQSEKVTVNLALNKFAGPIPGDWSRFEALNLDLSGNMITDIPEELCSKTGWNDGLVGLLDTCDAILCPAGTALEGGRQIDPNTPCKTCSAGKDAAPSYGSRSCLDPVLRAEQAILVDFYQGTNGTSWLVQTNWLTDSPPCTWYGVTCDDDGYVEELTLENNWLKATPETLDAVSLIFTLTKLKVLDLKGNDVALDFRNIPGTSVLEFIRLSGTGLKSLVGISRASGLKTLHVTNNHITTLPDEVFSMTDLESVFISFNSIAGTIPRKIGQLTNLQEFYAFGNLFTGTIPTDVGLMTELTDFVVASNSLSGEIPSQFSSLSTLEQLSVFDQSGLELITGPIPSFSQAPNLWFFDASNNDLTGPIPDNFMINSVYTNETVSIYLQNNDITGAVPTELSKFSALDLNLVGNEIVEIPDNLCSIDGWMQGNVGKVGNCSAILCPRGTFNSFGRHAPGNPCLPCPHLQDVEFLGQTRCENFTSERETLNVLYYQTGGEYWNNSHNWLTEAPICSWSGILCEDGDLQDAEGITGLYLDGIGLTGTLPSEVWTLPSLRHVSVKGNPQLYVDFEGLANAAETLEVLYLSGVQMSSLDGISQATSLKEIHVTGNNMQGTFPDELFKLSKTLESLYLAYNLFFGPIPTRIGELTELKALFAFSNDFLSTIPSEIGLLENLQTLVLAENLLYGQIPNELSRMPSLRVLSLFRREKSGPRLLGSLPSFDKVPLLTDLYLQGNEIQGTIPSDFLSSSLSPELVILSYNLLSGRVPESIGDISAMNLQLEGNKITDFPPSFCNNREWMAGAMGAYGCGAFLCPPGSASPIGRVVNDTTRCLNCTSLAEAEYFGSTSCQGPPNDRDILVNFYNDLNGDGWIRNDFWGSTADVCDWYGIACLNGEIIEINLRANNLRGIPSPDIFHLRQLQVLWLYSNPIKFSFENIGSARYLQDLRLDATNLHSLHGIGAAKSLTALNVRFTSVRGRFPDEILQLTNLRTLSMGNNELTGKLPSSFANIQFLVSLRLDSNKLTGSVPAFDDLNFLKYLDLSDNRLTGAISRNIFELLEPSSKVTINLAQNQLTGVVPEELDRFSNMNIYLRDNRILGVPLTLCDNDNWNDGDVGSFGCTGIMCKPGSFSVHGRRRSDSRCKPCPQATYYGESTCVQASGSGRSSLALVFIGLGLLISFL